MAKNLIRAVLLGRKGDSVTCLQSGDRDEVFKAARAISASGLPSGFDSVEAWDQSTGRTYLEDGSRCPKDGPKPAAKKAAKTSQG